MLLIFSKISLWKQIFPSNRWIVEKVKSLYFEIQNQTDLLIDID